jgi:CPA2 family monovalent cation:H+ antiporter-2
VVRGDPTKLHVLDTAGVRTARLVVIAEDEPEEAARIAGSSAATPTRASSCAPSVRSTS